MTIEARAIAHKAEGAPRHGKSACVGETTIGKHELLLRDARAHSAACNELTHDIYEALLRVKYMRAAK